MLPAPLEALQLRWRGTDDNERYHVGKKEYLLKEIIFLRNGHSPKILEVCTPGAPPVLIKYFIHGPMKFLYNPAIEIN